MLKQLKFYTFSKRVVKYLTMTQNSPATDKQTHQVFTVYLKHHLRHFSAGSYLLSSVNR